MRLEMEIEIINKVNPQITIFQNKQERSDHFNQTNQTHQIILDKIETEKIISDKEMKSLIRDLKKEFLPYNKRLKLQVNKEIERVVVKIIDKNTNEVIKEIPPVEIQQMIASIRRAVGLLINKEI